MTVVITDEARRYLGVFEDVTGTPGRDCVVDEEFDRLLIVVAPEDMAEAIGPGGQHIQRFEERVGTGVSLVEYADEPEAFVANALEPAAVYHVTLSENDDLVAYAEVDSADRGAAIGAGGENIAAARLLAKRHFGIDEIELA